MKSVICKNTSPSAVLGLHCVTRASSRCRSMELYPIMISTSAISFDIDNCSFSNRFIGFKNIYFKKTIKSKSVLAFALLPFLLLCPPPSPLYLFRFNQHCGTHPSQLMAAQSGWGESPVRHRQREGTRGTEEEGEEERRENKRTSLRDFRVAMYFLSVAKISVATFSLMVSRRTKGEGGRNLVLERMDSMNGREKGERGEEESKRER